MNSFQPTITLSECADEIVARDRTAQVQYNAAVDALDASLDRQKEDYENRIDNMACDYDDLEKDLEATSAKLQDQYEDNKFLDDEIYELNQDVKEAAQEMEALMADFEVININEADSFAQWAEQAYKAMQEITNAFPIVHYVSDYDYNSFEDANYDIQDDEVDWSDHDQPFNPVDYAEPREESWDSYTAETLETE